MSFGEIDHGGLSLASKNRLSLLKRYANREGKIVLQCDRCRDFLLTPKLLRNPVCPQCKAER